MKSFPVSAPLSHHLLCSWSPFAILCVPFFFYHHHWLKSHDDRDGLCLPPPPPRRQLRGPPWHRMCSINIWLDGRPWTAGLGHGCWNMTEGQRSAIWAGEAASQASSEAGAHCLGPRACFPWLALWLVAVLLFVWMSLLVPQRNFADFAVLAVIHPLNQNPLVLIF